MSMFRSNRALRLRSVLVVSQVALAVTLLIGAGLLGQTLLRLLKHDPGFNTENLVAASVFPPMEKYKTRHQVVSLYEQIATDIKALPVQSVGFVSAGPHSADSNLQTFFPKVRRRQLAEIIHKLFISMRVRTTLPPWAFRFYVDEIFPALIIPQLHRLRLSTKRWPKDSGLIRTHLVND